MGAMANRQARHSHNRKGTEERRAARNHRWVLNYCLDSCSSEALAINIPGETLTNYWELAVEANLIEQVSGEIDRQRDDRHPSGHIN